MACWRSFLPLKHPEQCPATALAVLCLVDFFVFLQRCKCRLSLVCKEDSPVVLLWECSVWAVSLLMDGICLSFLICETGTVAIPMSPRGEEGLMRKPSPKSSTRSSRDRPDSFYPVGGTHPELARSPVPSKSMESTGSGCGEKSKPVSFGHLGNTASR